MFKYAEIRPHFVDLEGRCDLPPYTQHYFHGLDLRPSIEELYSRLQFRLLFRRQAVRNRPSAGPP